MNLEKCGHEDECDITRLCDQERVYLCVQCDSVRTEER